MNSLVLFGFVQGVKAIGRLLIFDDVKSYLENRII